VRNRRDRPRHTLGIRNVDRGRATSRRGSARLGRITGWIGTILSILALIAFLVVAILLDVTADSVNGIVDAIRDEIDKVEVPDVNAPDVTPQTSARRTHPARLPRRGL
jgi:hypothetical protein